MRITGLSAAQFRWCTDLDSLLHYNGNVIMHADAHDRPANRDGTKQCTARLTVLDPRGPGSRTAANGRHGPYACWHAYRDVLMRVFTRYPNAVIRAGLHWSITYRGATGFRELYPRTASWTFGSAVNPVTMPELCECPAGTAVRRLPRTSRPHNPDAVATSYRAAPISRAVAEASSQYARSAELLGEKDHIDEYVFGPGYHRNPDLSS